MLSFSLCLILLGFGLCLFVAGSRWGSRRGYAAGYQHGMERRADNVNEVLQMVSRGR